jgi:glycosyltransferase involved in cell wall biosynthesis
MKTIAAVAPLSKRHGVAAAAKMHISLLEGVFNVSTYDPNNLPKLNADVIYVHRSPGPLPPTFIRGRVNVSYWCCESTIAAPEYRPHSQSVSQIWTPSEASRSAILAMDPMADVRVVPHPVDVRQAPGRHGRETFTILTCGAAPIARKNISGAFRAFRQAFPQRSHPHVRWVVKLRGLDTNGKGQFSDASEPMIAEMLATDPRIRYIHADISNSDLEDLYREADCYFQLHLFGAFELHCAEAASFGLPVICANIGGPVDYLPLESLIPVKMVPVPANGMAAINRIGEWADPDLDAAVERLRKAHDDRDFRIKLGELCQDGVRQNLNPSKIQSLMKSLIDGLPQVPPAWGGRRVFDVVRTTSKMRAIRPGLEIVGGDVDAAETAPIVASHRRSGTHHLGEFIRRNWSSAWLKTHDFPERLPKNPTVFIVRNPIDCLHSTWSWFCQGGGANNEFIAERIGKYSFNEWLDGKSGREFGFDRWPHKNRDSLEIHRGMFYDPIQFWKGLLMAHFEFGNTIITHERLRKDPQSVADTLAGLAFDGFRPAVIDPVSDLVGLGPHGKTSITAIGSKLPEWSAENLARLEAAISPQVLNVVGYENLAGWLES